MDAIILKLYLKYNSKFHGSFPSKKIHDHTRYHTNNCRNDKSRSCPTVFRQAAGIKRAYCRHSDKNQAVKAHHPATNIIFRIYLNRGIAHGRENNHTKSGETEKNHTHIIIMS